MKIKSWAQRKPQAWNKMLDMLASGELICDIAKETGIPRATISRRVSRYGRQSRVIKEADRLTQEPSFHHDDNARISPALGLWV